MMKIQFITKCFFDFYLSVMKNKNSRNNNANLLIIFEDEIIKNKNIECLIRIL